MRLTKSLYSWAKTRASLVAINMNGQPPIDQDDIAEVWGDWRDRIISKTGTGLSPRQVDILADYAMRWTLRYAEQGLQ